MKISGLQKVSLVDFNGHICATIFTSGCNFSCPFCHNAGLVAGTEPDIPDSEIFEYLNKRKNVLDSVCISGGEPTLNPDLPQFIKKIKDMGFLVKLDTNGTNLNMLKNLVKNKLIDYVAMDIKNTKEKYNTTIGVSSTIDLTPTIEYIKNCGIDYEFRTTIVSEFHSCNDVEKIAMELKPAKRYYLQKFVDSGNCIKSNLHEVNYNDAMLYLEKVKKYIPNTELRGY